jgi:hypothetical protein
METVISGALANVSNLSNQDLFNHLTSESKNIEIYELASQTGGSKSAAFDWAIVSNVSSVITIGTLLWSAYAKLIKPKKSEKSNSGIVINIGTINSSNSIWVGKDVQSEEDLVARLREILQNQGIEDEKVKAIIRVFKNSEDWKNVDPTD